MVTRGDFTHGRSVGARISAAGFRWSAAGEAIASGYRTPERVVAAWMASAGHCELLLAPTFADVGTGVAGRAVGRAAHGGATWAVDFALPAGRRAPSHNYGPAQGCPY
jgi:uncharacterized protein YkwD